MYLVDPYKLIFKIWNSAKKSCGKIEKRQFLIFSINSSISFLKFQAAAAIKH